MRLKPGFILHELGGEYVVVPVGEASRDFNGMVRLNETGAFLWKALQDGADEAALAEKVIERYDGVTAETARSDVKEFLESIREAMNE